MALPKKASSEWGRPGAVYSGMTRSTKQASPPAPPEAAPTEGGPKIRASDLDTFTRAYIKCALWSSTDNGYLGEGHPDNDPGGAETGGNPLDDHFSEDDLAPEALAECKTDCDNFRAYCRERGIDLSGWSDDEAGHDFWLTRNGHGAGFWDRGRDAGDALSEASKTFGSCDMYVGGDGRVYVS